jgi:hypothetical protein
MKTARLFWLASKVFVLHTLITLITFIWALWSGQPIISVALLALWLLTGIVWLEWRNS